MADESPTHTALREKLRGPVFSIVTPFRPDSEEIDFASLERYLGAIYAAGGQSFYVMAYNSRYGQLRWDEIKQLNQFVIQTAKSIDSENLVIVADPLHCSTNVSVEFARHAESCGADLISLLVRERYYSDDQILAHFRHVTDRTGIGVLIHEMPFLNGLGGPPMDWPLTLLDRVADIPRVIAIKEDAKRDEYTREVLSTIGDRLATIISGGGKRQWMRFADAGCGAWLNGIGVFEPRLATSFWRGWQEGRRDYCHALVQDIEIPFFERAVHKFGWHLAIKAALEACGTMSRHDRMPLMPLNEDDYSVVRDLIQELPVDAYVS